MSDRQRGVTLRVIQLDDLVPLAAEAHRQDGGAYTDVNLGWQPWAAITKDDVMYVVCQEGVGWEVRDDKPLLVEFWGERQNDEGTGKMISMFPVMQANLPPEEVEVRLGEEIDLADLVRKFGARLEQNFWTWHRLLSA